MKNITVSLHEETYRQAKVFAALNDTTVSSLVREFLESLDDSPYLRPELLEADLDPELGTPSPSPRIRETVRL
jgi:hypothetical protein